MLCKLWGKVTSAFLNINFGTKISILGKKKKEILGEILTLSFSVHALILKVIIFFAKHAYFQKNVTFCKNVYKQ